MFSFSRLENKTKVMIIILYDIRFKSVNHIKRLEGFSILEMISKHFGRGSFKTWRTKSFDLRSVKYLISSGEKKLF